MSFLLACSATSPPATDNYLKVDYIEARAKPLGIKKKEV